MKRFWSKVDKTGDCWEWTACKVTGYGRIKYKRKMVLAHRFSWELLNGPIPDGMLVCHHCDNKGCVNPDHLFISDQAGNVADMFAKGRNPDRPAGENNHKAKLCDTDVRLIRELNCNRQKIADWFGISLSLVYQIKSKSIWRHI